MKKTEPNIKDKQLWNRVARTVSPLKKGSSKPENMDFEAYMRVPQPTKPKPSYSQSLSVRADKKTRRGMIDIQARIDLHDLTIREAFPALRRAVIRSYNRNHSCLLVITGKGLRGQGVLKRSLPEWLSHPDIRPIISEYAPAHLKHGGGGAWYVFLKTS